MMRAMGFRTDGIPAARRAVWVEAPAVDLLRRFWAQDRMPDGGYYRERGLMTLGVADWKVLRERDLGSTKSRSHGPRDGGFPGRKKGPYEARPEREFGSGMGGR